MMQSPADAMSVAAAHIEDSVQKVTIKHFFAAIERLAIQKIDSHGREILS